MLIVIYTGLLFLTLPYPSSTYPSTFTTNGVIDRIKNEMVQLMEPGNPVQTPKHWSVKCWMCRLVTSTVQTLARQKKSKDIIAKTIQFLCAKFHIESERVCTGIVNEFKAEFLTVFNRVALDPDEICGYYVSPGCGTVHKYLFPPWNVTIPQRGKTPVYAELSSRDRVKGETPTARVLHITDTHYDSWYQEGTNTDCGEPLCCRKNDGPPPKGVLPAGKYGYYNCDTPTVTLEGLFKHVSTLKEKVDYIIWTGDVPAHNVWNQSRTDQVNAIKQATQYYEEYFPNTKVYPCLGNHESAPVNSFPPPFITGEQSNTWLLDAVAEAWGHWLPEECQETIKKGGYYTVLINKGLRLVSLNMNYCNNENFWLVINSVDPAGQLQWLIDVLQKSEDINEKVHIIGHIPPGHGDCLEYWSKNYYEIIDRYQNTVTAQFFGHTHHDHYELFYDLKTYKTPTNIAYIGPSVTPYTDLNPGYRIYVVDGDYANSSRTVLDHETYYLDLDKANKLGVAKWELEYTAKDAYKMASLTPKDWNDLIDRMKTDDTLFQRFYRNYVKQHVTSSCTDGCKISLLCSLREGKSKSESELCQFSGFDKKLHRRFMFSLRKC